MLKLKVDRILRRFGPSEVIVEEVPKAAHEDESAVECMSDDEVYVRQTG